MQTTSRTAAMMSSRMSMRSEATVTSRKSINQSMRALDGRMNNTMMFACASAFGAGLCMLVGFVAPTWLVKNSRVFNEFENIGLWTACFKGLHLKDYYDKIFSHCRFVFHAEYEGIQSWLEPAWFICVQVFFTLGLLVLMFALFVIPGMVMRYCFKDKRKWLLVVAVTFCIAFAFHLLAVVIFAVRGDDDDWMIATLDANKFGPGFGFSVVGVALEAVAAVLLYVEWKREVANKPSTFIPHLASAPPPGGSRGSSRTASRQFELGV